MAGIDTLNGKHEDDCLMLARRWAQAARHDPPASGDFLAADLDRIGDEIERLRNECAEWKSKWMAMAQAGMIAGVFAPPR